MEALKLEEKTSLTPIKHKGRYPNLIYQLDIDLKSVQVFLPFIEKYTFLEAYLALNELINCALNEKIAWHNVTPLDSNNRIYTLHNLASNFLAIHAILTDWEKESFHYKKAKDYLEEITDKNYWYAPPLTVARYLDDVLQLSFGDDFNIAEKALNITLSLRKTFLSIYASHNNLDLSEYLGIRA